MKCTSYRPTWVEIDLDALRYNFSNIRKMLSDGVDIMGVVKANAYGHGICEVSRTLVESGVDYLGVATVDEALKIRSVGIDAPVLVMSAVLEEEAEAAIARDITLTLCDSDFLSVLSDISVRLNKTPKVHIKVDTGMGRIGVWHEQAVRFIKDACARKDIEIEGVYTHFSSAGRDKMITRLQIGCFENILGELENANINIRYKHSANSIAIVDWPHSHLNLVRSGVLLYGVYPKEEFRQWFDFKPVLSLKTKIVYLKDTPPGRSISYGRTYITQKHTKIATIPIGYGDGYGRILSNRAEALVNGKFTKVVGIVTMDQTLLDVGDIDDISVGDEVVLIGRQAESFISVEKISRLAGTIPYEILACITDRVPRVYKDSSSDKHDLLWKTDKKYV